jgi:hypothetical protein
MAVRDQVLKGSRYRFGGYQANDKDLRPCRERTAQLEHRTCFSAWQTNNRLIGGRVSVRFHTLSGENVNYANLRAELSGIDAGIFVTEQNSIRILRKHLIKTINMLNPGV